MSPDEQLIARLMFVNRILRANGTAFQHLFWSVKRAKHGINFVEVQPQGSKGDGGNDGYVPSDGHYFQIYGPIDPSNKIDEAVKKLEDDFLKVVANWNSSSSVNAYTFVLNDKYQGTFKDIALALAALELKHPTIRCRPYTAAHLEDEFMALSPSAMNSVLGALIPDPSRVIAVDYGVMREVINHIMSSPSSEASTRFGELPTLLDKIALNHLCAAWGDLIRNGARSSGHVDNYFSKNSTFMKQVLRDHIVRKYEEARVVTQQYFRIPPGVSREDLVFNEFRDSLLPPAATVAEETAVAVLVGYFFETCDVFDSQQGGGSPSATA